MIFFIGRDFFPYVDSGQMNLHVNPPEGLRLEDSEQYFASIEREIRQVVPAERVELIIDNIGQGRCCTYILCFNNIKDGPQTNT